MMKAIKLSAMLSVLLFNATGLTKFVQMEIEKIGGEGGGWIVKTDRSAYQLFISKGKRIYQVFMGSGTGLF